MYKYIHTYTYAFHRSLRVTRKWDVQHVINIQTHKNITVKDTFKQSYSQ